LETRGIGNIKMMVCDICKSNDATVHLTQIVGGKMKKVNLCEGCSKEKGVQDPTGFSMADMLLGLGTGDEMESVSESGTICPGCGFTLADFKKLGRLGCSQCYKTFAEGLESVIKMMHKAEMHVGKKPARAIHNLEVTERLEALRTELEKAVGKENFENAAALRDEIEAIKKQL